MRVVLREEMPNLAQQGDYLKGVCIFCNEDGFSYSLVKEIFYCFGCQTGGDLIAFICKLRECSPITVVHYLENKYLLADEKK